MKTKILELIDRKIDCCTYHVKDDGSEMSYGMRVLGELRSEIEKMEDDTIKAIDTMIEELNHGTDWESLSQGAILKELKQRLSTNQ